MCDDINRSLVVSTSTRAVVSSALAPKPSEVRGCLRIFEDPSITYSILLGDCRRGGKSRYIAHFLSTTSHPTSTMNKVSGRPYTLCLTTPRVPILTRTPPGRVASGGAAPRPQLHREGGECWFRQAGEPPRPSTWL